MKPLLAILAFIGSCQPPSPPATTDRCPQHRAAALEAGWSEADWPRLDAIAWRESRCKPDAFNGRGRDRSYGLLQLNMRAHAAWVDPLVDGDFDRLFDPQTNFTVALALHRKAEAMFGCGWQPWVTRNTRAWCQ